MPSGWQAQVGIVPAPAVEGDFASTNPRFTLDAGPGGLVTGSVGATVGRFAWATYQEADADNAPAIVNNFGFGPVSGFIHREQQALITQFLADAAMVIPQGFPVTLMTGGDFWVKNAGTTQALVGQKAYASLSNGTVNFAATGAPSTASINGSIASNSANTFVGSVAGNLLTVTSVVSGTILNGMVLSGGSVATNSTVIAQLTGSTGLVGTYSLNIDEQSTTPTTLTLNFGVLTVGTLTSGTIVNGGIVAGGTATAGTYIIGFGTGTGGTGTYFVTPSQTTTAAALTVASNVETKWYAFSSGLTGELVKISDHASG